MILPTALQKVFATNLLLTVFEYAYFPIYSEHWVLSNVFIFTTLIGKKVILFHFFVSLNIFLHAYWWPVLLSFWNYLCPLNFLENWFFIFLLICKKLCRKLTLYHMNYNFPLWSVDGFSLIFLRSFFFFFCHE